MLSGFLTSNNKRGDIKKNKKSISAQFPFESKFIEVHGSNMHYIEQGKGDPILFLHGNPTSSYLWRNIIPHIDTLGRCIALDLIGMGKSDKPDIGYRFVDHYKYVEGFIDKLQLKNITLVIHDWGSGLGFHYATMHEKNVKAIAFMEGLVKPWTWAEFDKDFKTPFKLMRTAGIGWFMISVMNGFLNKMMPQTILRDLSKEETAAYHAPFETIGSRKPIRQWPCEIPIDGTPDDVHQIISQYSIQLQKSKIPKLLLYAEPGAIIKKETVQWCIQNIANLETANVGDGIHYIQEDHPHEIGEAINKWYKKL